jgi:hypothetical protein
MNRTCHWCNSCDELKCAWCWGNCDKEKSHSTNICRSCYSKLPNVDPDIVKNWDKLTWSYKLKEKPFDASATYSYIVKYYMDKKNYSKEHANEVALKSVKDEMIRRGLIPA